MHDIVVGEVTLPSAAISWTFSRSSGPGGSGANTASTRVTCHADLSLLEGPAEVCELIRSRMGNVVTLHSSVERYQLANRRDALARLTVRIEEAMKVTPLRKKKKVPKAVKERRLLNKRLLSEKKTSRKAKF